MTLSDEIMEYKIQTVSNGGQTTLSIVCTIDIRGNQGDRAGSSLGKAEYER
jgi:GTPase Era involved in 16S rRNA processing